MTPTTTSPISDQAAGEQDQEGFERFAAQQGYDVKRSGRNMSTSSGIFPATYYKDVTEHAWRGWANRRSTAPTTGSAPEPIAWYIADDNGEVYAATGYEHERDGWRSVGHVVYDLYAAPASHVASAPGAAIGCHATGQGVANSANAVAALSGGYASPAASVLTDDMIWNIGAMNGIARPTELVDDDQWNEIEPLLMKFARALLAASMGGDRT